MTHGDSFCVHFNSINLRTVKKFTFSQCCALLGCVCCVVLCCVALCYILFYYVVSCCVVLCIDVCLDQYKDIIKKTNEQLDHETARHQKVYVASLSASPPS